MIASGAWHKGETYCKKVASGKLVACEAIRGLARRHLADIDRQSTKRFPFHFDANKATAMIELFEVAFKHSIGEFAGLPLILEPWQAWGVGMLFGWLRDDDGSRRFRNLYWSMGRKNGKTTLASGLAHVLAGFDINPRTNTAEQVAEVVLAATKKEQVEKVMFAEACRMRQQSQPIRDGSELVNRQITYKHNNGSIRCIGSDKPYDGLNPHAVLLDEVHAFREVHREFYNTMTTGSGSRLQPLNAIFTTAGDDRSYLWLDQYRYAKKVALGQKTDHALLPIIYEIDEEDDTTKVRNWIKANPNLGVSLKKDYLKQQASRAKESERQQNVFNRYHANQLVSANVVAFNQKQWEEAEAELSNWLEADCVGAGVDPGGRDDFGSFALCARFETGKFIEPEDPDEDDPVPIYRFELRVWTYLSDQTERDVSEEPFAEFIAGDHLRFCRYPITEMKKDLLDNLHDYDVESTAYDPSGGQDIAEVVDEHGFEIASMGQTTRNFNEPITEMQTALKEGRLNHDGNPVLSWAIGNAVLITDRKGAVMYDKAKSREKIDALVAATMAFRRACLTPSRPASDDYFAGAK